MKIFLIVAVFALLALTANGCEDKKEKLCGKIDTSKCFGLRLIACPKTCDDCEGVKGAKFKKIMKTKSICEDAIPEEACAKRKERCDKKRVGNHLCRKTCGKCA